MKIRRMTADAEFLFGGFTAADKNSADMAIGGG